MSRKKEKYARRLERRVDKLEDRVTGIDAAVTSQAIRIIDLEDDLAVYRAAISSREERKTRQELAKHREERSKKRERERVRRKIAGLILIVLVVILAALIAASVWQSKAAQAPAEVSAEPVVTVQPIKTDAAAFLEFCATQKVLETPEPTPALEWEDMIAAYLANPAGEPEIEEALLAQTYLSIAAPLPYEFQAYMREYCAEYGCPYPLALAVAEVESHFNMGATGAVGEVGIMQLNPGPGGSYHAEIEAATGLDPTTPAGNIAGGCYKLGEYMAMFQDANKAAMAYNMGLSGARDAWANGVTSTDYSKKVLEAMERWECTVNAWGGV